MNAPFLLKPAGKDYLWGGRRLRDDFGKDCGCSPLAETWECSVHPAGESLVASGVHKGETLGAVLHKHPEYMGASFPAGQFPLLIKLIDADKDLSIQVHPDDAYARTHAQGARGKTELWYVLDAKKGARLYYGFKRNTDRREVEAALQQNQLERLLQSIPVKTGDVFFVRPGTVHAIGTGVLIAEIQTNSNLTYRLYDYGRKGRDGRPRPLHLKQGLEVLNYHGNAAPRQPMRILHYRPGCAVEQLFRCSHFAAERMFIQTQRRGRLPEFRTDVHSFQTLLCVDGCGCLCYGDGERDTYLMVFKGDCIFLPADGVSYRLHGRMELVRVRC